MQWFQNAIKLFLLSLVSMTLVCGFNSDAMAKKNDKKTTETEQQVIETGVSEAVDLGSTSIFEQAWRGGFVVFSVLMILIAFSISSWAIFVTKWITLKKTGESSDLFIKGFWDSRSLNELNSKLSDFPSSPAKEVFKTGYAELIRGSQLREQTSSLQLAVHAAVENMSRSLLKAKKIERRKMEVYLSFLAIIASASPFIGLFGTVWGIMGAFEGIAKSGNASLAAVAPGISEALIATAFGLAAAIPAVIGYNTANAKIRDLASNLDGFSIDFLNIVERYLVAEKKTSASPNL